jgi:hypothetical protein
MSLAIGLVAYERKEKALVAGVGPAVHLLEMLDVSWQVGAFEGERDVYAVR